jgi:hypothetical protein
MGGIDRDRDALHAAGVALAQGSGRRHGRHRDPGQRERSPERHVAHRAPPRT